MLYLLYIYFKEKKDGTLMIAILYAGYIMDDKIKFSRIPKSYKERVAMILINEDAAYLIDDDAYKPLVKE